MSFFMLLFSFHAAGTTTTKLIQNSISPGSQRRPGPSSHGCAGSGGLMWPCQRSLQSTRLVAMDVLCTMTAWQVNFWIFLSACTFFFNSEVVDLDVLCAINAWQVSCWTTLLASLFLPRKPKSWIPPPPNGEGARRGQLPSQTGNLHSVTNSLFWVLRLFSQL